MKEIKPIPLFHSVLFFGIAGIIMWLSTHFFLPWLVYTTGMLHLLGWILVGAFCIFIPLFIAALFFYRKDGGEFNFTEFKERFRLRPMTKLDWEWTFLAFLIIIVSSAVIVYLQLSIINKIIMIPPFLVVKPLHNSQLWILLPWIGLFFFNMFGEELLWRGYLLPRQELTHKKFAWLINASLWTLFHLSFGLNMVITLIPLLVIIPIVVQKRKNTWIGIILHAIINGPGFILVALGAI
ncbi:MAG: type II CAAX endopeptidase family protein [bacterium]